MRNSILQGALLSLLAGTGWAADFYVANSGSDANDGRSPGSAWASPARVSSERFRPGDRILFKAGETFRGTVRLGKEDSGTADASVEIGVYGMGRASLAAGRESGIVATDVEHLAIRNLVIFGDGPMENEGYGVLIENTGADRRLKGLEIDSVEANGFGKHGIVVTGATHGYEEVRIDRCSMSRNRKGGLEVAGKLPWDAKQYAHKNVTVSECRAFDNPGDPAYTQNHSGSGLVLYQVDTGRIEKCAAWNNGGLCPAGGGGPVGIWTCASRRVVIEYCESFANQTQGLDGGGFDIDGGSEECVLQYNYSHDNEGPGLMVYTYPYASHQDRSNVVRFNISIDDAVKSDRYGGLYLRADGRKMEQVQVYNNTIVTRGRYAAVIHAQDLDATLSNNLFVTGKEGTVLRVDGITNELKVTLRHNLYWRGGAPFLARWGERDVNSLADFRAETRQEIFGGEELGLFADPQIAIHSAPLTQPVPHLRLLTQFQPQAASIRKVGRGPAIGMVEPALDLLGNELGAGRFPLGAIGGP